MKHLAIEFPPIREDLLEKMFELDNDIASVDRDLSQIQSHRDLKVWEAVYASGIPPPRADIADQTAAKPSLPLLPCPISDKTCPRCGTSATRTWFHSSSIDEYHCKE
jgi:hypothetical protein